ncbi:hypothetical protein [Longimicrobium terrae]|uniref:Uncharacterized protein n=1 Tax=Longimicrobium terrae TaxID=1639882 RepID=A0A841GTS1_9BACT|nr:hypothetical protein [Longimicrobium terrae]MBB4635635.1 hypothetical protein [Longimicrobium terrae]MBB6070029.1 hypothetical protein [Longimicrobium terrae]NNC32936.1 hypothetical protein [Longimicrobium terrae]
MGNVVRGTLAGAGDADEYAVRVSAGTPVNAVLEVPPGAITQLRASIHRQHPVTGALAFEQGVIVGSDEGEPGATEPVMLESNGTVIIRVEGMDSRFGGAYVLRVLPTAVRELRLGETIQGTLAGRSDSDDYTLTLSRATRFNARVSAPHRGAGRLVQVQVFERNPVTGQLRFLVGAITDSREGTPAATDPVVAPGPGTYVVRVHGMEAAGAYEIVTEQL